MKFISSLLLLSLVFITIVSSSSSSIHLQSPDHKQCQSLLYDSSLSFLQSVNSLRESIIGRRSSPTTASSSSSPMHQLQSTLSSLEDEIEFGIERFGFCADLASVIVGEDENNNYNKNSEGDATEEHAQCHVKLLKLADVIRTTLNGGATGNNNDNKEQDDGDGDDTMTSRYGRKTHHRFNIVNPSREEYGPSEPAASASARVVFGSFESELNTKKEKTSSTRNSAVIPDLDSWIGEEEDVIEEALKFWY